MGDSAMHRVLVSADSTHLVQIGDDEWTVIARDGIARFDLLLDAVHCFDSLVTTRTRIAYHDGLDELVKEMELSGEDWLFPESDDGLWCIRSTYGINTLWVPLNAESSPEKVFTEIGTYGERGYFTRLYRWKRRYLFSWDNGWEERCCGWEVLGRIPKREAVEEAVSFADELLDGVPDDLGVLDDWPDEDDRDEDDPSN